MAQQQLIHFWDFNQTQPASGNGGDSLGTALSYSNPVLAASKNSYPLPASYTRVSAGNPRMLFSRPSTIQPGCTVKDSITDNGGGGSFIYDYSGYNYNFFNSSDSNLTGGNMYIRTRNPSENSYMYMYIPTTGWQNIHMYFALTASSSKGARYLYWSYSKDGGVTWNNLTKAMDTFNIGGKFMPDTLQAINPTTAASNWYPVQLNFTSDAGVNNNANFVLRWEYEGSGTATGTSGNDRFDNFAVFGDSNTAGVVAFINRRQNVSSCYGDSNGSARVYVVGGTPPYDYSWSNNATNSKGAGGLATDSAYGLKAGTYTVTVTDLNDNAAYATVTILQPTQVVPTITGLTEVSCHGGSNAAVSTTTSGGTSPYTYSWSDGKTGSNITGLSAGSYTLTVTDKLGCTGMLTATITQPTVIVVDTATTSITCFTLGSATASSVTGGTPYKSGAAYKYSWSSGATTSSVTGLGAGSYTVTATDSLGCTGTAVAIVHGVGGATITVTPTPVTCPGGSNGSATSTASGGTLPYTYTWSNGSTATSINGLTAGNYTLTLTDHNGCISNAVATVTQPATLTDTIVGVTPAQRLIHYWDFNQTPPIGGGGGDSLATLANPLKADFSVIPTTNPRLVYVRTKGDSIVDNGGGAPYAYVNDLHACGNDTASLAANNAFIRTRNPNKNSSFLWYLPTTGYQNVVLDWALSASSTKGTQYLYFSYSTDGGTTWNHLTKAMDTFNIGGKYMPDTLLAVNSVTKLSNWYPVHIDFSSVPAINNNPKFVLRLQAEGANVSITSGNSRFDNISLKGEEIPKVSCNNGNNGSGAGVITGGTKPYTYAWSTGATGDTATNLVPGINTLTVTDAHGCTVTASVNVVNPPALKDSNSVTNGCHNSSNGTATSIPSGGTGPYSWSWSTGSTSNLVTGLAPGTYTVTVTDIHGCTVTATATITNPPQLSVTTTITPVTCNGSNNGTAIANPTGGTGAYTYKWSSGAGSSTSMMVTGLKPGSDTITVTDANGCTATASAGITQPGVLTDSISASVNVSCNAGNNGSATVGVAGGNAPYTYSWTNGATSATAVNLTAGSYTVTVNDANGCGPVTASVTLTEPTAITTTTSFTKTGCTTSTGTATVNASGGTPGYSYLWNTGGTSATVNNLSAGVYTVTVTDLNSCSVTTSVAVTTLNGPTDSITTTTNNLCFGGSNGSATVGVSGGSPGYTYSWSNGATSSTVNGLTAGSYTVFVTDNAGCATSAVATLVDPAQLRDSITNAVNLACNGVTTGKATVGVAGGTSPYSFSWSSGGSSATETGLAAGSYTVTVMDNNGCSATASVSLTQPPAWVDSVTALYNGCIAQNNGMATISVGGATPPYTYSWSNGATTATATGLGAGTYTVDVFDKNACALVALVTIKPDSLPVVTFKLGSDSVQCDTVKSLALTSFASPSGGSFSGPDIVAGSFKPATAGAGKYTITYHFTNGGGCTDSAMQTIRVDTCTVLGIAPIQGGSKIVIYPNPNNGNFTISGMTKGSTIELYNDLGQLVSKGKASEEIMQLNIASYPNGIYLVRLINDNGTTIASQKVIKTN